MRELVDRLAAGTQIETEAIGEGGSPSEIYANYKAVVAVATREEILALLFHRSVVVRGYLAAHVFQKLPADAAATLPLLRDPTVVKTQSGCVGTTTQLSNYLLDQLSSAAEHDVSLDGFLVRVLGDRSLGAARGPALSRIAARRPAEARTIALSILEESEGEELQADALRTLGILRAKDLSGRIAKYATSKSDRVRAATAAALGRTGGPEAKVVLRKLLGDSERYVRFTAARSYGLLPDADPGVLRDLLADSDRRVSEMAAEALAESGTPAALALLEGYLGSNAGSTETLRILAAGRGPQYTEMMRRLLGSTNSHVRTRAIVYVGETDDRVSAPKIRPFLTTGDVHEKTAAAAAAARLGDLGAIPGLESLLGDANPNSRVAAAEALVKLKAVASIPALEAAVAADTAWSHKKLEAQLDALRALKAAPAK